MIETPASLPSPPERFFTWLEVKDRIDTLLLVVGAEYPQVWVMREADVSLMYRIRRTA